MLGAPVRDLVQPRVVLADAKRWTEGKQQLTAARLYTMLCGEGFDVGYTVVKDIVHEWKRQRQEVFVPLVYKPGDLGEVDFFEVLVDIGGERSRSHRRNAATVLSNVQQNSSSCWRSHTGTQCAIEGRSCRRSRARYPEPPFGISLHTVPCIRPRRPAASAKHAEEPAPLGVRQ